MDKRPIGVMDSGLGGLSVLRVLREKLPNESFIFVGDQGHFPYGTKSQAEIRQLSLAIGHFLVNQGIKLMVIACNTATAAALTTLQESLPIPVIGVIEPGAAAALAGSPRTVGVIATNSTIKNGAYEKAIHRLQPATKVISQAAQSLVPIVEHGQTGTAAAQQAVNDALAVFDGSAVRTLVLGCTHFPFLAREIQQKMGTGVRLVDPAFETVQQVQRLLADQGLSTPLKEQQISLFTTGQEEDLRTGADHWLAGHYTSCRHLDLAEE